MPRRVRALVNRSIRRGLAASVLAIAAIHASAQASVVNQQRATAIELEQSGQLDEAEAAWHAVLRVHPNDAEAYAHLGLLEAHQEHYEAAVPLYRKALALNPADGSAKMFVERCTYLKDHHPGDDWDGVWVMKTK